MVGQNAAHPQHQTRFVLRSECAEVEKMRKKGSICGYLLGEVVVVVPAPVVPAPVVVGLTPDDQRQK